MQRTSAHHRFGLVLSVITLLLSATGAQAAPISGQGTWETTLQARDLNSDGTVDAWYDTTRNVSWLADAGAITGTVYDDGFDSSDGRATFASAQAWLAGLDVFGVTGWRMPGSDLVTLYADTLGNAVPPIPNMAGWRNTGLFENVVNSGFSGWYWRGDTPYAVSPDPNVPLMTRVLAADHLGAPFYEVATTGSYRVWAVHDGDIAAPIPEPSTYALMLAGLAGLAFMSRRRTRSAAA